MKFEMHMHTSEVSPCSKRSAFEGIKDYKEAGYDGVVITDHFNDYVLESFNGSDRERVKRYLKGYYKAKEAGSALGIRVLFGIETCLKGNEDDFLIYGVTPEFLYEYPKLYEMSLEKMYESVHQAGGLVIQAHPFRGYCQMRDSKFLDGVEVFNGNPRHDSRNYLAKEFMTKHSSLIKTSGSDYHERGDVARGGMEFTMNICSEESLKKALVLREYHLLGRAEKDNFSV